MQRSSESIASLAAALAKAQVELVNPEKSLAATIEIRRPERRREIVSLRAAIKWAGDCAQDVGPA